MASFSDKGIQDLRAFVASVGNSTHAQIKAARTSAVENEDAFEEMKQHILELYRGVEAQHSFLVEDGGQVVDCIPIEQQPAIRRFGGPVLKPRPLPEGSPSSDEPLPGGLDPESKDRFGNAMWCPDGTIPMRRITLDEMARFRNVGAFLQKSPLGGGGPRGAGTGAETKQYATAGWGNQPNNGGYSTLNVWNPTVQPSQSQLQSLSQIWFYGGIDAQLQSVEAGWQVQPLKFGTTSPVLFCFYTPDNYQTGCYNLECPQGGFVQTNPNITLGTALTRFSSPGGAQVEFGAAYSLYEGAWWLYLAGNPVGYYPLALFQGGQLASNATWFQFGGETTGAANWPPMGSGAFASAGQTYAAYQRNIWYYDVGGSPHVAQLLAYTTSPGCFTVDLVNKSGLANWNTYFFFGGPGGTNC